jgi:type IV secretion system protein TrbL
MNDTGIIDEFLSVFSRYIDSGFGLLGGEVGFLSSTLIVIDVTIAALFWAWGTDEDILQRLIKKTLYVGTFAYIIGNFATLADILLESFAGLGLKASGSGLAMEEFMRPGIVAQTGIDAAQPLLEATADLVGPVALFTNIVQILILLLSWAIVVLAFFILAIQVFVTIIEFKLVTLAGFILLPFAFFGRTAFLAERVLGHIITSGIKLLVLAVITGIGTTLFTQFVDAGLGVEPDVGQVLAIALGALTLLGLGIFGPGIANGIVAGGPQLGAGSAAGTTIAASAAIGGGVAGAKLAGTAAFKAGAGAFTGSARAAGAGVRASKAAREAYRIGAEGKSGGAAIAAGVGEVSKIAGHAAASPLRRAAATFIQNYETAKAGSTTDMSNVPEKANQPPAWATALKRRQSVSQAGHAAAHTLKGGDSQGGGSGPDISDKS